MIAGAGESALVARFHFSAQRVAGFTGREPGINRHCRCFIGVKNPVAVFLWQVAPRFVHIMAQCDQNIAQVLTVPGRRPGGNGTLANAQGIIGNQGFFRNLVDAAQTVAARAGALRRVG